ncbi:hypothetical protein KIPB_007265, partial [Kipferlia bialata]
DPAFLSTVVKHVSEEELAKKPKGVYATKPGTLLSKRKTDAREQEETAKRDRERDISTGKTALKPRAPRGDMSRTGRKTTKRDRTPERERSHIQSERGKTGKAFQATSHAPLAPLQMPVSQLGAASLPSAPFNRRKVPINKGEHELARERSGTAARHPLSSLDPIGSRMRGRDSLSTTTSVPQLGVTRTGRLFEVLPSTGHTVHISNNSLLKDTLK